MSQGYQHCVWRWLHQTTRRRRTGKYGSMYYKDDTLYSYGTHWPLAKRVKIPGRNGWTVLLHTVPYSNTTNRHVREVESGASPVPVMHVENDLWDSVVNPAALERAIHTSMERQKDREYEEKERKRKLAIINRRNRAEDLRTELVMRLGCDELDKISDNFSLKLARRLHINTQGWYSQQQHARRAALHQHVAAALEGNPALVESPGELMLVVDAYEQLTGAEV